MENLIRKVRFPLKIKLNLVLIGLLLASLSLYVYFALDLFLKDKSAYIYENASSQTESLARESEQKLEQVFQSLSLMSEAAQTNDKVESATRLINLFKRFPYFYEVISYQKTQESKWEISQTLRNTGLIDKDFPSKTLESFKELSLDQIKSVKKNSFLFRTRLSKENIPYFYVAFSDPKAKDNILLGKVRYQYLSKIFESRKLYKSYVLARSGGPFILTNPEQVKNLASIDPLPYQKDIINSKTNSGVKTITQDGVKKLVSYHKMNQFQLVVFSEILHKDAYKAADFLISKSLYFGLFVICLSLIVGIFFSKRVTFHIQKLFNASQKIAAGDFDIKTDVRPNDEIGALSDSFNYMSQKILSFIEEMKEKARLENELKVANLVQSSFFPEDYIETNKLELASFFRPASECGGDWWGHIQHDGKFILIIADATGHGVPAALLTATINSCKNDLESMIQIAPSILESPSKIMSFINKNICKNKNDILLTCFVAIIDEATGNIKYANASHNPPLHLKMSDNIDKSSFIPLLGESGHRLGHNAEEIYQDCESSLSPGDSLIFFTDGLTECANTEGKQYGNRRFLKSMVNHASESSISFKENILNDAIEFCEGNPPDDDITLVVLKLKE